MTCTEEINNILAARFVGKCLTINFMNLGCDTPRDFNSYIIREAKLMGRDVAINYSYGEMWPTTTLPIPYALKLADDGEYYEKTNMLAYKKWILTNMEDEQ